MMRFMYPQLDIGFFPNRQEIVRRETDEVCQVFGLKPEIRKWPPNAPPHQQSQCLRFEGRLIYPCNGTQVYINIVMWWSVYFPDSPPRIEVVPPPGTVIAEDHPCILPSGIVQMNELVPPTWTGMYGATRRALERLARECSRVQPVVEDPSIAIRVGAITTARENMAKFLESETIHARETYDSCLLRMKVAQQQLDNMNAQFGAQENIASELNSVSSLRKTIEDRIKEYGMREGDVELDTIEVSASELWVPEEYRALVDQLSVEDKTLTDALNALHLLRTSKKIETSPYLDKMADVCNDLFKVRVHMEQTKELATKSARKTGTLPEPESQRDEEPRLTRTRTRW